MSARELVDALLRNSGRGSWDELAEKGWIDCQPDFETAHYLNGFHYADGKFRFAPDWPRVKANNAGPMGPYQDLPELPDHWDVTENADAEHRSGW